MNSSAIIAAEPAALSPAQNKPAIDTSAAEFDIERHGDVVLVPVYVEGTRCYFAIDTGSVTSVLDARFKSRLTPTDRTISDKHGNAGLPLYQIPEATLGENGPSVEGDVACVDMARMRKVSGFDIRGILGMSFLNKHAFCLDFDSGKLTFLHSADRTAGTPVQLTFDSVMRPTVQVSLGSDGPMPLLIDTGMISPGFGEVTTPVFDQLLEEKRLSLIESPSQTITFAGQVTARKGLLERFKIGDFDMRPMSVREGTINAVGLGFLSRFVVTFDFPNKIMYLKKGKRFADPTPQDRSGLMVSRVAGETWLDRVFAGSPAAAGGIESGDVLVSVDGKRANEITLFELRHLLAVDGREVDLVVRGIGGKRDVKLKLSNWQKNDQAND
jgi:hypothetical protein